MGTTYNVTCCLPATADKDKIKRLIDRCLIRVNRSMSTYDAQSELSRFNAKLDTDPMPISLHFYTVLNYANTVYKSSNYAWDGTLKPIVDLWGFGPKNKPTNKPSDADVKKMKVHIGFSKIHFFKDGRQAFIQKKDPSINLDLGSIAKGYGSDHIAAMLKRNKVKNFIVEVGGEIYVSGEKTRGEPWIIGINHPEKDAALDQIFVAVALKNQAVATSGDYRNWIDFDGESFSHTIDPRTLRPLNNHVISTTIIAPNCTLADGLATAVMILGPDDGLKMIQGMKDVSALIVTKVNGEGKVHASPNFRNYLVDLD